MRWSLLVSWIVCACTLGCGDVEAGTDGGPRLERDAGAEPRPDAGPRPPTGAPIDDPSRNVFDTFDPACDGSDSSIVFCDGFEDGEWIALDDGHAGTAENDFWVASAAWSDGVPRFPVDSAGRAFAECGAPSAELAAFGAAGTPCTATQGWITGGSQGVNASHWMFADASNPRDGRPVGSDNVYLRFYFKEAGETSGRCEGGVPCPAYQQDGPNGYKVAEFLAVKDPGGISASVIGQMAPNGPIGVAGHLCCHVDNPDTVRELYSLLFDPYNVGPAFDLAAHRDEWIFIEAHVIEDGPERGVMELWIDACGRDGLGCTGTPTLRQRITGYDFTNTGEAGAPGFLRGVWINFWNSSSTGEIQVDEIVVRDGNARDEPIGFAPVRR